MEKDFKFINQKDIYQYKFYMIPKELFVNERYISLSTAAILLYGILLDRLTLSIKNNWVDKNGNIYGRCQRYGRFGKFDVCSPHNFNYQVFEEQMLEVLREVCKEYTLSLIHI